MAIITISRGTFDGGKAVAEALAKHMEYPCVSREMLVKRTSETFDIPEDELMDSILQPSEPVGLNAVHNINTVKYLRATILELGHENNMVYHGFGGQLLLQDIPQLLRVRVVAGMEHQEHAMNNQGISREPSMDHIEEMDQKRAQCAPTVWSVELNDPATFDLVINLDRIAIQGAVEIIAKTLEQEAFQEKETDRQTFEDELIMARVWAALTHNKPTRSVPLQLKSCNGNITIIGDVRSHKMMGAVMGIAEQVQGVKSVTNTLALGSNRL